MLMCFPDRARITKGKKQALTLNELEKREQYMLMPEPPRDFLPHVHIIGSHINLQTIPELPTSNR